ncbi:hypothetical protein P0D75_37240 [Paraburkholderia sediminicola]|uniref:hypothetical protein n=1 Tax=Paraburkholderia sediminicola TaxID=458836 RepID=UPI001C7CF5F1
MQARNAKDALVRKRHRHRTRQQINVKIEKPRLVEAFDSGETEPINALYLGHGGHLPARVRATRLSGSADARGVTRIVTGRAAGSRTPQRRMWAAWITRPVAASHEDARRVS